MKIKTILVFMLVLVFFAACAQTQTVEQSSAKEASNSATIEISDFKFVPETVTIKRGGTVNWEQKDSAPHKISIKDLTESPTLNKGDKWSYTFDKTGSYNYICSIHPSMSARIIVK